MRGVIQGTGKPEQKGPGNGDLQDFANKGLEEL